MKKEAGCVLVALTQDESEDDLLDALLTARELAAVRGVEELRVVRVVEALPRAPVGGLDHDLPAELVDPDGLANPKKIGAYTLWNTSVSHRVIPSRDIAGCILAQVEEHEPAALVLMTGVPRHRLLEDGVCGDVIRNAPTPVMIVRRGALHVA